MPKLNHTGPDQAGQKTGRKLWFCKKKSEIEKQNLNVLGQCEGKRRHADGGTETGKGKRKQYDSVKNFFKKRSLL